jgi:PAS domain-containing protein
MSSYMGHEPFLLRSVIDLIPSIIFVRDLTGKLILANKAYAQYFGLEPQDIEGFDQKELYAKQGWVQPLIDAWLEEDKNVVGNGIPLTINELVNHRNGIVCSYQTGKYPLKLTDGRDAVLVVSQRIPE